MKKLTEAEKTLILCAAAFIMGASVCGAIITIANAAGTDTMIDAIIQVVCTIVQVVGGIFGIVGIVKFAISHANEQAPEQQKAAMMIATAVVLIILPAILKSIDWNSIITSAN